MKPLQLTTIILGLLGATSHLLGVILDIEYINFIGALLGRLSAIVYLAALDKFRLYYLIPLVFAIANIVVNVRYLMYLEFASHGFLFQIIAYVTFRKLNSYEQQVNKHTKENK